MKELLIIDSPQHRAIELKYGDEHCRMSIEMWLTLYEMIRSEVDESWRRQLAAHIQASCISG